MLRSVAGAVVRAGLAAVVLVAVGGSMAVPAGAAVLPDGRGYELVSPPDKNGADILPDSQRTRAAVDGGAMTFASLGAFADVHGTSYASEYMAERSTSSNPGDNGWRVHGITPPQAPLALQGLTVDPLYTGAFSPDLQSGVFLAWSALTDDPDVQDVSNLYVRNDLRTPGPGSYELLSGCPLCATAGPLPPLVLYAYNQAPYLAGTASDMSHAIFESRLKLTPDAPGVDCSQTPGGAAAINDESQCATKLYESDHGVVRLAGILPDGSPAPRSIAGQGAGASLNANGRYTPHTISSDGRRIFFTVPSSPQGIEGELYMRVDNGAPGAETLHLNASERSVADPGGAQDAKYWDASVDGGRVFFTSSEALTDDAPLGNVKLYMYDTSKPDSDPHNLKLVSDDQEPSDGTAGTHGVIGASTDGYVVYFLAAGQLVAGGPPFTGGDVIYRWDDSTGTPVITDVAPMSNVGDRSEAVTGQVWVGFAQTARVSPDGRYLLFSESGAGAGPTGVDQGHCNGVNGAGCRVFYLFDAGSGSGSGSLRCVSCDPGGGPATSDASVSVWTSSSAAHTTFTLTHPLSDDGRRVFFASGDALVAGDVNGKQDVYEYDSVTGSVSLVSSGTDPFDSYFMNANADGADAYFLTRARLVGWDTDNNLDVYDARVGGGFPEPAVVPGPCSGDGCRGPGGGVPALLDPASVLVSGHGNVKPAPKPRVKVKPKLKKCKRGFVRKRVRGKVRCVKRRPVHHARQGGRVKKARRAVGGRVK